MCISLWIADNNSFRSKGPSNLIGWTVFFCPFFVDEFGIVLFLNVAIMSENKTWAPRTSKWGVDLGAFEDCQRY